MTAPTQRTALYRLFDSSREYLRVVLGLTKKSPRQITDGG